MARQALGKGLGALIRKTASGENASLAPPAAPGGSDREVREVPVSQIVPSPLQPRSRLPDDALDELLESIRQHGVIQPLIVRSVNGQLELIAGERRWRASRKLGLETVPVIEREATDREVLEMALVENLQRADLNPIEEGTGYSRLAREFGLKQEEIAQRVGKSRAAVANTMRLLDLHEDVQDLLANARLTVGHAKAILGIKDKPRQLAAAEEVIRRKFTVRRTEQLVHDLQNEQPRPKPRRPAKHLDPETEAMIGAIVNRLREHFATRVSIHHNSAAKGRIELEYYGNDDLTRILDLMQVRLEGL